MSQSPENSLQVCDVHALSLHGAGPQWGTASDDLNVTVLSWPRGEGLEANINAELDVVIVVLAGEGEAFIEDEHHHLRRGVTLLIPKGAARGITSTSERLTYLSIHRRRAGLMPK